jgi:DNA polymerase-1
MPIITKTSDFPNLNEQVLGVDTETWDPGLIDFGPGWAQNWGHLVGVSLATLDGKTFYFPLKHEVESETNLPWAATVKYLTDVLSRTPVKVGANVMYDIGWLMHAGIDTSGIWYDVQFAEALLNPTARSYSLETLGQKYLKAGKQSDDLYKWAAEHYRGAPTPKDQGGNIHRCPARLVGPYACKDASMAVEILQLQQLALEQLGLEELFVMECKLAPFLVKMRMRGMCIDELAAQEAADQLRVSEEIQRDRLCELAGRSINVNASADIALLFDKLGLSYPRTAKGNPSFTAPWLNEQHTPVASLINNIRKVSKARTTFIENAILDKRNNGKIYPSLHPLRSDEGGTVTGRFSCSKPNGQQIPSRDDVLAPIIRSIFIPERGYTHWCKMDFSQIEYRMFAHFSGSEELISAYQDEDADFHEIVGNFLGGEVPRRFVKNLNFAKLYGAQYKKLSAMLSAIDSTLDVRAFIKTYETKFPVASRLMDSISQDALMYGEIRTLLNRRTTFNLFIRVGEKEGALPYAAAAAKWGMHNIERAGTYKALNYLLQGSAADYMKKGLLDAYEAGIFDRIGYPHILVHDEVALSYHNDLLPDFIELKQIMENAIPLKVPMILDTEFGPNWAEVSEYKIHQGEKP